MGKEIKCSGIPGAVGNRLVVLTIWCHDPELFHQLSMNLWDVGTESWSENADECSAVQWLLSGELGCWRLSVGYMEQLMPEFMGKRSVPV